MLSHWLNHWLQVALLTVLNVSDPKPKDITSVGNEDDSETTQTPEVTNIMAAIHSHDTEGPLGWIGKGINTLLKAQTGMLSKEDGQVK